ncbi:hypothetical protein NBRC10512_004985 [Rhodotorula toruloides]|uniref:DNA replication factor A subunit Ssb3 n=2 Tax=Rhodotorula toruloides TaxID=5286 RepID=A0A061AG45_RHOTO|nr:DNA replication factor A subunit Ssb3 [Rhodotorula toruloides NP11]EMS24447.1 DNA replication factor A subunit Ssb3 [Rhodotorula toruloides NP11]PRQ77543.1 Replication factor A protein 3 [Rhodotorula toruloides]GEM08719.1 DNA replication factor A subunit Ssb3 [Rhodotorula toruloides]CDR36103.1 RHTO0S01e14312g1_1 [Rhodotorula toruloides]
MDRPTPRVNGAKLAQSSPGSTVRLIGKVISLDAEQALLEAADGAQVTVKLMHDSVLSSTFVEVIGKVQSETSMQELSTLNLGDNIDMEVANKVVELTHQYPDVFPPGA